MNPIQLPSNRSIAPVPSQVLVLPELGMPGEEVKRVGPNLTPPVAPKAKVVKKKLSEMTKEEIVEYEAKIEADKIKAKASREQTQSKAKLKLAMEVGVDAKFSKYLTKAKGEDQYHFKFTNLGVDYLQDLCRVLDEFILE